MSIDISPERAPGALPIITADQRLAEPRGIKGCIFGRSGLGKTSLLWTLNASTTLFFDLEAGDLAIEGWQGDTIRPRTWTECRDFAVFIGGPNPALREDQPYSQAHYAAVCARFGDPAVLGRYDTVFIDSITVAGRLCFQWCKGQPEALSEKTGKPDVRGAYGLHGREMIAWLTHLQHTRAKNVWFVGILDEKLDDFNRKVFSPQIDGSKTGLELPGIVDQVITMAELPDANGKSGRAFVCHTLNPWGFPAKDRSGRLAMVEAPHLGQLMEKVHGPAQPAPLRLTYAPLALPSPPAAPRPPATLPPMATERTLPMTGLWNDFNDARSNTNLIPKGTPAKVRLTIRPGGFDDASQGWTGGYATRGSTGAVFLNGEFTVTEGPYARRKVFTLIGLYSPKGPDWANMGRSLVRGMLNSARGISDKDMSAEAQAARRIGGFADLDGIEFIARIDIGTDAGGDDRNEIRSAVTPDHRDYAQVMGTAPLAAAPSGAPDFASAAHQTAYEAQAPAPNGRPSWAD